MISWVLFGSGEAANFAPGRDESQWWGRRDAHCRITAAALFNGVAPAAGCGLLYQDLSYMWMTPQLRLTVPTEASLIGAWRDAAAGRPAAGVRCVREGWRAGEIKAGGLAMPLGQFELLDKRQMLLQLQNGCAMEFLRAHNLNKKPALLLKNSSRAGLTSAYREWLGSRSPAVSSQGNEGERPASEGRLEWTLESILAGYPAGRTAVVLLHEDYPLELPVFGPVEPASDQLAHVVFVLGAVRDMRPEEESAVMRVASRLGLSCVGCNLGRTAEFTSKIVLGIAGHHASQRLFPAVHQLIRRPQPGSSLEHQPSGRAAGRSLEPIGLHTVLWVPFSSAKLGLALPARPALHPLIQVCVCALWRSKLAEEQQQGGDPCQFALSLVFTDGLALSLRSEMVLRMAARHQAAPSEHQVLAGMIEQLELDQRAIEAGQLRSDALTVAGVLSQHEGSHPRLLWHQDGPCPRMREAAYSGACECEQAAGEDQARCSVVLLLGCSAQQAEQAALCVGVGKACEVSVLPGASAALVVTVLQHWHYHGRLAPAVYAVTQTQRKGSKRKRSEDPEEPTEQLEKLNWRKRIKAELKQRDGRARFVDVRKTVVKAVCSQLDLAYSVHKQPLRKRFKRAVEKCAVFVRRGGMLELTTSVQLNLKG